MSIQESINKALNIGAVLTTQSPLREKQKIKYAKASEIKRLNTQAGILEKKKAEIDTSNPFDKEVSKEANRQLLEVNQRLFELAPTLKTSTNYYNNYALSRLMMDIANSKADIERLNKKTQKQAFKALKESKKNGKT